ncbi:MAG: hypothetical protein CMM47_04175 [Rhodospirillaceae bacterium]|nr:hypothetical protein [Rhodospirillaceae bacterium]
MRTITVEQGSDPRQFSLVAFGGGGPLHASSVAQELGIARIIIPDHPGLFSAHGIAEADFSHDYVRSMIGPVTEIATSHVIDRFAELERQASRDLKGEGVMSADREITLHMDMRYVGQTTEIQVPIGSNVNALVNGFTFAEARFHELHQQRYSYNVPDEPVELVNLRLYAVGRVARVLPQLPPAVTSRPTPVGTRTILLPGGSDAAKVPIYTRNALPPGAGVAGPALVEEASSTTLLLADMTLQVDPYPNLIIEPSG